MNGRRCLRRTPLYAALAAACVLSIPAPAGAATDARAQLDHVRFLLAGEPVRVIDVADDQLVVEFVEQPGSRAEIALDNVSGEIRYQVHEALVDDGDVASSLKLAETARDLDLPRRRLEALHEAERRGADEQTISSRLAEARQACAADRLARARTLVELDEVTAARHHLREAVDRYPGTAAADAARALLEDLADIPAVGDGMAPSPEGRVATESGEAEERQELGEVPELVADAREAMDEGRALSEEPEDAIDEYADALEHLEQAREALDARASEEGARTDAWKRHDVLVDDLRVRAHIESGYANLALGKDRDAYHHATTAAGIDPGAGRVSDLRQAIASSDTFIGKGQGRGRDGD